ncbi:hypothetical protein ACVW00_004294 [Marmoricola sp. URHA0025 HA25]
MSSRRSLARPRRAFIGAIAVSLAFLGLAIPRAADAAPGDNAAVATVTPASVTAGSHTNFTLKVTGGNLNGNVASRIEVDVPAGFNNVNVVANSFTTSAGLTGWSQGFQSPQTIVFTQSNASKGLGSSEFVQVHVTADAIGSGDQSWTTRAWKGPKDSSNALPVLASPVVTITGGTQAISLTDPPDTTWPVADFDAAATSTSSANPITFGGGQGAVCTVSAVGHVHVVAPGDCTIVANQAAGKGYTAAPEVQQTFTIAKASQTITFADISDAQVNDLPITPHATSSSGLTVAFDVTGDCSYDGSKVTIVRAGACSVTAHQPGDAFYKTAAAVTKSFGIAKDSATVSLSDLTFTYDGHAHAPTVTTVPAGLGVTLTYSRSGAPVTSPTDAGAYVVTATVDDHDYTGAQSGSLVINKAVVVGHFTAQSKTYDGSTDATKLTETLSGAGDLANDDVHLTGGVASFESRDAGSDKTVTLTGASLTGNDSDNYTLSTALPITATADIDRRPIHALLDATDKEYDRTTDIVAGEVSATLEDGVVVSPDVVGVAIDAASFDGTDVGAHIVTATVHLTGGDRSNYELVSDSISDAAGISKRLVTGSLTVADRVYDGSTNAVAASTDLDRDLPADDVHLVVPHATFTSRDVGTWTVNADFALGGARASQYALTLSTGTTTASITPAGLTAHVSADSRTYDTTTYAAAHAVGDGLSDLADPDDDVQLVVGSAHFDTKTVGAAKDVTVDVTLAGTDAGNYSLAGTAHTVADITPAPLTATITAASKSYDATTHADTTSGLSGVLGTDVVHGHSDGAFEDKNVGTGKVVSAAITIDGADSGNYTVNDTATATADITPVDLTATAKAHDKVYDSTTDATSYDGELHGLVNDNEKVTLHLGQAHFDDKNVGADKLVTVAVSIDGADAANYTFGPTLTTKAGITPLAVTASITADPKTYDGTTGATVHPSVTGLAGDDLWVSGTGSFANKNAGTGKTVTSTDLTLHGADAGNYTVNSTATTTADIAPVHLLGLWSAASKVYDGDATATVTTYPLAGVVPGDSVTLDVAGAHFDDELVGTGKTVTTTVSIIGGNGNYVLTNAGDQTTTADITARPVTGSITADNKGYDGTSTAVVHAHLGAFVSGDDLTLSGTGTFADKNAGAGKKVTSTDLALAGADAGNYSLVPGPWTTTATITAKPVTGSFTPNSKVWDGTDSLTTSGLSLTGVLAADAANVTLTGGPTTFPSAAVGDYVVAGTGFSLTGSAAGNYSLTTPLAAKPASITPLYSGKGFYAPVDMPNPAIVWNTVKGGQTVPLKFEIFNASGTVEQSSLAVFGSDPTKAFTAKQVTCDVNATNVDALEVVTTGGTSLRYDSTAGQYIQNWKTPVTANACYKIWVTTQDGTTVGPAYFQLKK